MHIILWLAMLKHKYMYKLNFINLEAEHELIIMPYFRAGTSDGAFDLDLSRFCPL